MTNAFLKALEKSINEQIIGDGTFIVRRKGDQVVLDVPEETMPATVGFDGRCLCSASTPCPLGKTGMAARCTTKELNDAGVSVHIQKENSSDKSDGSGLVKEHLENFMKEASTEDPVNHPQHYTNSSIECIEAIRAALSPEEYRGFLKGQVFKYLWREQHKENPLQDLEKAQWYLTRLIKEVTNDSVSN